MQTYNPKLCTVIGHEKGRCQRCGSNCEKIIYAVHGFDRPIIIDNCECHGQVSIDDKRHKKEKTERRFKRNKKRAGVIERYKGMKLDTFPFSQDERTRNTQKSRLETVSMYAKKDLPWLIVYGGTGTGKTTVLQILLRKELWSSRANHFKRGCRYLTYNTLATELAHGSTELRLDRGQVEEYYKRLYFLALDEYGTSTKYMTDRIYEILRDRHETKKQTVIASNLNIPGLTDDVSRRLADKAREGTIIHFNWKSLRKEAL